MGRVSQARAAENRERVVATASRLFRERGVENVSIADVMAEAVLTVGAFYKQFESKEAHRSEAFAYTFDDAARSWSTVVARTPSVYALAEHYLSSRPARYTCPILAIAAPASHSVPEAEPRATYAQGVESLYAQFCEAAGVNHDDAEPSGEDPRVTFAAMIGAALLEKAVGPTE
ncbi:TetR/AcrR family transcriptional regulator [Citricoccus muralis]|uniref:TetR family transcriptional regulator n=1 Tax=Citricoccus muralis TaxID=169134 RepID=A0ABY8H664_9MICC|nr:TetR family transcriptional regulator [Citricoccus muralis]WFP16210.1 TetR family transcriptional regulator [Citricoccus muralis]